MFDKELFEQEGQESIAREEETKMDTHSARNLTLLFTLTLTYARIINQSISIYHDS